MLDELEREILLHLAAGEDVVSRILTMRWFTYESDGESFVVGPEMQQRFEQLTGAKLIEYTPAAYPLERALGFHKANLARVREMLSAAGIVGDTHDQNGRS
jgi:hypothetical protein